jgi:oxaloacetate decarboxylase alpha subunit/pyruvate carboxylase subunit B
MKKLLIRDLTLRDGQQSQLATRMNQAQIDEVLPLFKDAGFFAMEVWGGAVPDSIMRYLNENPWHRLEAIKAGIGDTSKLTALSRGRNLFGYAPYPEYVLEGFYKNAIESGISIMRIFDALNDVENMKSSIATVKKFGGIADCAVCYTTDPKFTFLHRLKCFFTGKKLPPHIFTTEYFVNKAKELQKHGADIISIKDMAGLIDPESSGKLIRALKKEIRVPVNLHTHCTPGFGVASTVMAMVNGVDIVDTVVLNFSGGPAAPGFEIIQLFANKLGLETGVNPAAITAINKKLGNIRKELATFDQYKLFPREFDLTHDRLPADIEKLFDTAVEAAIGNKAKTLLDVCHKIEKWFNYPAPDAIVKVAQIPGGMYTNMLAQLQQAKLSHLLKRVLEVIPQVRLAAGLPPLVTPTSQIVGVQAVNCVVDEAKGKPFYTNKSAQFVNLVKGIYGKTPYTVDPEFRFMMSGVREETPYDTSKHVREENPVLQEYGGVKLAVDEKEELLLELFPMVAKTFLKGVREAEYLAHPSEEELRRREMHELLTSGISSNYFDPDAQT